MKKLILILIVLSPIFKAKSQDSLDKRIIHSFIQSVYEIEINDNFIFTDSLKKTTTSELVYFFNKSLLDKKNIFPIELTQSEIEFIKQQLFVDGREWFSNFYPRSKRIKSQTTFVDRFTEEIHSFSNPIFIRNNSFCFFYKEMNYKKYGTGEFIIYKIENGKWIPYWVIYSWVT
jgi:hypothetical protein